MCVIVVKDSGVGVPDKDTLINCFYGNSDGAGFCVLRDGIIHIFKGFMGFKHFYKAVESFDIKEEEPAIYHFRIATHGRTNEDNCHPFPVTDDEKLIRARHVETNELPVLAHNGMITIGLYKDLSDTATFVKEIVGQKGIRDYLKTPAMRKLVHKFADTKLAIMFPDGDIDIYGSSWEIETNGLLFSNTSYKYARVGRRREGRTRVYTQNTNNYYSGHWWKNNEATLPSLPPTTTTFTSATEGNTPLTYDNMKWDSGICPYCLSESLAEIDVENEFAVCGICGKWWNPQLFEMDIRLTLENKN